MRKAGISLEALPEVIVRWCEELGLSVSVHPEPSGDEELFPNRLALGGPDAQWLLASKGQALDALQFLLQETQGDRDESRLAHLDVQSFRLFRLKELKAMTTMAAKKAREYGGHTFSAMSPRERRWVHMLIAREADLASESEGTGTFKTLKVTRK
jgi:predicted RNA-binding protein Jag